jgi:ADP-heptose:LPS heptosyltransferase
MPYRNVPIIRVDTLEPDWGRHPGYACVVRYGGIGDVIQASSILPALKRQGFKVAFNCEEAGFGLLRENPHIDLFIVQKRGFIPVANLESYWERMSHAFDKYVMLSGSIEGTLLAHPTVNKDYFTATHEERHAKMNRNYLEHIHELADVPFDFDQRFYSSPKEQKWARREAEKFRRGNRKLIMVSLSGSSIHKCYPYWDWVIGGLARAGGVTVVTVGDMPCKILEAGWERWPAIKCRSGELSIRKVLALAEVCDLVVGTETGVMNAVGLRDMHKILMLSHSSVENLSKHWKNTLNIVPDEARCHPCHKMHLKSNTCSRRTVNGERGAWCTHVIKPIDVLTLIGECLFFRGAPDVRNRQNLS